jgi:hypothetical protein
MVEATAFSVLSAIFLAYAKAQNDSDCRHF